MANEINIKSEPNSNIEVTDISTIATDITEGTIIKVTADETYNSNKQYIQYDSSNSQVVIQDEGYFNCIKNGYYSIANEVNHYYTLSGNNYNYNTVPNISSWTDKWSFSNTIKDKTLYSISPESDRICVNNSYYEKSGNNYIKQSTLTYNTYNKNLQVDWSENNKYTAENEFNEEILDLVTRWKTNSGTVASSGYYLAITNRADNTFTVQLLNITFNNNGVAPNEIIADRIYKLSDSLSLQDNKAYIKNGSNNYKQ